MGRCRRGRERIAPIANKMLGVLNKRELVQLGYFLDGDVVEHTFLDIVNERLMKVAPEVFADDVKLDSEGKKRKAR